MLDFVLIGITFYFSYGAGYDDGAEDNRDYTERLVDYYIETERQNKSNTVFDYEASR